jgi:hypothetical protein
MKTEEDPSEWNLRIQRAGRRQKTEKTMTNDNPPQANKCKSMSKTKG